MNQKEVISVSQYLDTLNTTLRGEQAKIVGEVSELKMYEGKSYLFFSLRDTKDQSVINCIMWKNDFRISGVVLQDGMEIIITAYPEVYKPSGRLTFKVELVELVGEGALKIAYEKLKNKLETEGLFADSRKRMIPEYPHRIGVITSRSGAVINDFLSNLGKFGYQILFVDSRVEGQDAVRDLLSAIDKLKNQNLDVLVVMRGGGSLESFLAFNNETLVRAIASFPVPVLTGIGHDKDVPLVSFVSDKNVSTPTAVANLLNSTWDEALSEVRLSEEKIFSSFQSVLVDKRFMIEDSETTIQNLFTRLLDIFRRAEETLTRSVDRIELGIQRISDAVSLQMKELYRGFSVLVTDTKYLLTQTTKTLELSNPERQLARGYSIVKKNGRVLRSVRDTKKGDRLDILVSDGIIKTQTQ